MPFYWDGASDEQIAEYNIWLADQYAAAMNPVSGATPIAEIPLTQHVSFDGGSDTRPGRRLRVVALLKKERTFSFPPHLQTFGDLYEWVMSERWPSGEAIPLQAPQGFTLPSWLTAIGEKTTRDPELHPALQDLAYEIGEDIREACFAFNDHDLFYPGVDEGIDPVPDEHVELVIWGMQRELDREKRQAGKGPREGQVLPAVPLAELPWRIQRALAERRRWRYKQYGIGEAQWRANAWSVYDVPEDPEFVPRRALRLAKK